MRNGVKDIPLVGSETIGADHVKVGLPNPAMEMCFELEICPDLLLAGIAAAAAGAFFFLYQAITVAGKKRRRRRSFSDDTSSDMSSSSGGWLEDVFLGNL